jgi:DNA invertase Pin-like site-specific DNA recombinase
LGVFARQNDHAYYDGKTPSPQENPVPPLRCSVYVRLSREAGDTNLSRDGMVADCRALAERLGLAVIAVHVDNGKSGAIRDRPAFTRWLEDATTGRADVLVTWHTDRLTREGVNAAALVLDVVEGKDPRSGSVVRTPVRLIGVDGLDSDDSDSFRWRFVIAAEVARAERARIVERNRARSKRLKDAGRWAGGPIPYGTRVVDGPGGKRLDVDPHEARILREAAHRILRGDTAYSVMGWLNSEGHLTRRGIRWSRPALVNTLTSEPTATHVLSTGEAREVRRLLAPKASATARDRKPGVALLRGLIICPACGHPLATYRHTRGWRGYRCVPSNGCAETRGVKAEPVEAYVAQEYLDRFGIFAAMEERVTLVGADALDDAEREAKEAEEALALDLSPEVIERVREARSRLAEAQAVPIRREVVLEPTGRSVAEEWTLADLEGRRRLLSSALVEPIALLRVDEGEGRRLTPRERLVITWRGEGMPAEDDPGWLD